MGGGEAEEPALSTRAREKMSEEMRGAIPRQARPRGLREPPGAAERPRSCAPGPRRAAAPGRRGREEKFAGAAAEGAGGACVSANVCVDGDVPANTPAAAPAAAAHPRGRAPLGLAAAAAPHPQPRTHLPAADTHTRLRNRPCRAPPGSAPQPPCPALPGAPLHHPGGASLHPSLLSPPSRPPCCIPARPPPPSSPSRRGLAPHAGSIKVFTSSRPLSRNRSRSCNPLDSPPPALPAAGSGRAPNSAPDTSQLYRFLYIFLPFPGIGAREGGAGNPHPESSLIRAEPPPCKSDHQAGNGNDQTLLLSVCRQIIPLIQ